MKNIDIILYMYDENKYTYAQSGAFFEAIQYTKPIIFLKNHNFAFHNTIYEPFGLEVPSLEAMATEICRLMGKNSDSLIKFLRFKDAIPKVRAHINDISLNKIHNIVETFLNT